MHVRFSSAIGLPVSVDKTADVLGILSSLLIHPDTFRIEGFFVAHPGALFSTQTSFLQSADIVRFGTRVWVRHDDVFTDPRDLIRLQPLLDDGRTVLDQRMIGESGAVLGTCRDVQFETLHFMVEWLFPKGIFRWGLAVPTSSVSEVKKDAVVIRDMVKEKPVEPLPAPAATLLPPALDAA